MFITCSPRGLAGQQPAITHPGTLVDIVSIDSFDSEDLYQTEKLKLISNGLPPIQAKLVKRVEEGLFVEMAKLLPSYL